MMFNHPTAYYEEYDFSTVEFDARLQTFAAKYIAKVATPKLIFYH